jgi:hypothetical protein
MAKDEVARGADIGGTEGKEAVGGVGKAAAEAEGGAVMELRPCEGGNMPRITSFRF